MEYSEEKGGKGQWINRSKVIQDYTTDTGPCRLVTTLLISIIHDVSMLIENGKHKFVKCHQTKGTCIGRKLCMSRFGCTALLVWMSGFGVYDLEDPDVTSPLPVDGTDARDIFLTADIVCQ